MDKLVTLLFGIAATVVGVLIFSALAALPIWLIWNGMAPKYFTGLGQPWQDVPFMDAWLMVIMVRALVAPTVNKS